MPDDRSESKYEIEFDDQGRIRVRDPGLAHRLIRLAGARDGLDIVIVTPPVNTVANPIGVPKINPSGCTNICPFKSNLHIDPRVLKQWEPEAGKLLGRSSEGP